MKTTGNRCKSGNYEKQIIILVKRDKMKTDKLQK